MEIRREHLKTWGGRTMTVQAYLAIITGGLFFCCLDPTWAWPLQLLYVGEAAYLLRTHRNHPTPAIVHPADVGLLRERDEQV